MRSPADPRGMRLDSCGGSPTGLRRGWEAAEVPLEGGVGDSPKVGVSSRACLHHTRQLSLEVK